MNKPTATNKPAAFTLKMKKLITDCHNVMSVHKCNPTPLHAETIKTKGSTACISSDLSLVCGKIK